MKGQGAGSAGLLFGTRTPCANKEAQEQRDQQQFVENATDQKLWTLVEFVADWKEDTNLDPYDIFDIKNVKIIFESKLYQTLYEFKYYIGTYRANGVNKLFVARSLVSAFGRKTFSPIEIDIKDFETARTKFNKEVCGEINYFKASKDKDQDQEHLSRKELILHLLANTKSNT